MNELWMSLNDVSEEDDLLEQMNLNEWIWMDASEGMDLKERIWRNESVWLNLNALIWLTEAERMNPNELISVKKWVVSLRTMISWKQGEISCQTACLCWWHRTCRKIVPLIKSPWMVLWFRVNYYIDELIYVRSMYVIGFLKIERSRCGWWMYNAEYESTWYVLLEIWNMPFWWLDVLLYVCTCLF